MIAVLFANPGRLPAELGQLSCIQDLRLHSNRLSGKEAGVCAMLCAVSDIGQQPFRWFFGGTLLECVSFRVYVCPVLFQLSALPLARLPHQLSSTYWSHHTLPTPSWYLVLTKNVPCSDVSAREGSRSAVHRRAERCGWTAPLRPKAKSALIGSQFFFVIKTAHSTTYPHSHHHHHHQQNDDDEKQQRDSYYCESLPHARCVLEKAPRNKKDGTPPR